MTSTSLYEHALYADSFRKSILNGELSDDQLRTMLEKNELNSYQLAILHELAPNIQQQAPAQQPQGNQPTAPTPNANQYKPKPGNDPNAQLKQEWKNLVGIIKQAKLVPALQKIGSMKANDKYLTDITQYIIQALTQLNAHINPPTVKQPSPPQQGQYQQQQQNNPTSIQ